MPATALGVLFLTQPHWHRDARCAETDPETFYPEAHNTAAQAKSVCGRCPVQGDCLEAALARDEPHGIWAGLSRREREALRRLRNQTTGSKRRKAERNTTIAAMARDKIEIHVIASEMGISERTVHRVLRVHRSQTELSQNTRVA